ncbi:MAG: dienelactone hydrolase family protein, partial [Betaproteobacteria bacterium]|nr:dienelactone hydrolase family protein [Betaproteobacteria bacterium]
VKELGFGPDLPLRFIFPQAPSRPISINNGYVMPGWYDIAMMEIERKPDEGGIRESQGFIDALIEREIVRGIASDKIVLAGFSQGGAIALQTGLRSRRELAGVLALSTYLTLEESLAAERAEVNRNIPILMCHGTQDPIVPLALAEKSRAALERHGYRVEWKTYPMPHSVCPPQVEDIAEWIAARYASFASRIMLA